MVSFDEVLQANMNTNVARPVSVNNPGYCPVPVERPDGRNSPLLGRMKSSNAPSMHKNSISVGEFGAFVPKCRAVLAQLIATR
jgi:hypothetical protein